MVNVTKKKMGRPVVGAPKNIDLRVRIDAETKKKINSICRKEKISKSELIRRLINEAK